MTFDSADLPWNQRLWYWQPFHIDALGLVTLLGSDEINASLGRLVPSRYLEYFPLLGAFVIAGERFKEKKPSFNCYNLSDGIHTTDLSFWLPRWMLEQEFEMTRSVVHFEVPDKPRSWRKWHIVSALLSFIFLGYLIAMTVLIGDWYGLANAIAMVLSILTRAYTMQVHRNAIDDAVLQATGKSDKLVPVKKYLCILSDSKAITMFVPGNLILPVFVYNPEPKHPFRYHLVRYIGWVVFGVHIITIGQATLVPQLYSVALLVIPTVLICWRLGCDDSKWKEKFDRRVLRRPPRAAEYECWIGTRLKAYISEWPIDAEFELRKDHDNPQGRWYRQPSDKVMKPNERSKKRQDLYAWLNLTADEEASLGKWDLFPHRRDDNASWWDNYNAKKALINGSPLSFVRRKTNTLIQMRSLSSNGESDPATPNNMDIAGYSVVESPARSATHLTSNGFVAPNSPFAAAFVRAGIMTVNPGTDMSNVPLGPRASRRGYFS